MRHDRSPIWIGIADLLLCMVSVVIVAVAPTKAKADGVKPKAESPITADCPVASIQTSTFGLSVLQKNRCSTACARSDTRRSIATASAIRHL